jgi:hypothetical protein
MEYGHTRDGASFWNNELAGLKETLRIVPRKGMASCMELRTRKGWCLTGKSETEGKGVIGTLSG